MVPSACSKFIYPWWACFFGTSGDPPEVSECRGPAAVAVIQQGSVKDHPQWAVRHPEASGRGAWEAVCTKVLPQREICLDRRGEPLPFLMVSPSRCQRYIRLILKHFLYKQGWAKNVSFNQIMLKTVRNIVALSFKDGDTNSLTTDNMERHGHLSHPALPDGGALLSEAKLQSIMSFLDEMEKSEQERPRSGTLGSNRAVSLVILSFCRHNTDLDLFPFYYFLVVRRGVTFYWTVTCYCCWGQQICDETQAGAGR